MLLLLLLLSFWLGSTVFVCVLLGRAWSKGVQDLGPAENQDGARVSAVADSPATAVTS